MIWWRAQENMSNVKILMESNDVGTYLGGWGMSIATQRAKEHEKMWKLWPKR